MKPIQSSFKKFFIFAVAFLLLCALFSCDTTQTGGSGGQLNIMPDESEETELRFTVSFDSQGGSSVVSLTALYGETISEPAKPTKEHFSFCGWYKDKLFASQWNFATDTVTSSVTLFAKWEATTFSVDSSEVKTDIKKQTLSVTLPSNQTSFSLTGKIFLDDENYSYTVYYDKEGKKPVSVADKADFSDLKSGTNTFYLIVYNYDGKPVSGRSFTVTIYVTPVYTIHFYTTDGEICQENIVPEGTKVTLPDYEPLGYFLSYWQEQTTGETIKKGQTITAKKDMELYGRYEPAEYTLTFNTNGGSPVTDKITVSFGEKFSLPTTVSSGKYFLGWYTQADVAVTGSNGVGIGAWHFTNVTVLYAKWENIPYTVTVKRYINGTLDSSFNGGKGNETYNADSTTDITLTANAMANKVDPSDYSTTIYIFNGWYKTAPTEFLTLNANYVAKGLLSSIVLEQRWSTVTVYNRLKDDSPIECMVTCDDFFPVINKKTKISSTGIDKEHTFEYWQTGSFTDKEYAFTPTSSPLSLICYWETYQIAFNLSLPTTLEDWKDSWEIRMKDKDGTNVSGNEVGSCVSFPVIKGEEYSVEMYCKNRQSDIVFAGCTGYEKTTTLSIDGSSFGTETVLSVDATWVDSPLNFVYDNEKEFIVTYDYSDFTYSLSVKPEDDYFYAGAYADSGFAEEIADWSIPTAEKSVYLKIIDNPVHVVANMSGAGEIEFYKNKAQVALSTTGKKVTMPGVDYNDNLFLHSDTYNGYIWLGWYYKNSSQDSWKLWTISCDLDWKYVDREIYFRATWKKIIEDIQVSTQLVEYNDTKTDFTISEGDPSLCGTVTYKGGYNAKGDLIYTLEATINPGYVFEGWYISEVSYDINNSLYGTNDLAFDYTTVNDRYAVAVETELSKGQSQTDGSPAVQQYIFNLSEKIGEYDLSTIVARYSVLNNENLAFYTETAKNETPYYYSETSGEAVMYGYYVSNPSISGEYLYRIDLVVYTHMTYTNAPYLFNHVTYVDFDSLLSEQRAECVSERRYENGIIYTLNPEEITSEQKYRVIWNEPKEAVKKLSNTDTKAGTVTSFVSGTKTVFLATPNRGYAFDHWVISESGANDILSYQAEIEENGGIAGRTYTAYWIDLISDECTLTLLKNIEDAGSTFYCGYLYEEGVIVKQRITLSATTEVGYIFLGWFDEENNLITKNENYTFICTTLADKFQKSKYFYTAKWQDVKSDISYDKVTDYAIKGYISSTGEIHYYIAPSSDVSYSYLGNTLSDYQNYKFSGWITPTGNSDTLSNVTTVADKYIATWEKIDYAIQVTSNSVYGDVAYSFVKDGAKEYLVLYANPHDGYAFYGWYNDNNTQNDLKCKSYEATYGIVYKTNGNIDTKFTECIEPETNTVYFCANFVSISHNIKVSAGKISGKTAGKPTYKGYLSKKDSMVALKLEIDTNTYNGYFFRYATCLLRNSDESTDSDTFYDDVFGYTIQDYENIDHLTMMVVYDTLYVKVNNSSSESGTVRYYGMQRYDEQENRLMIKIIPNNNFVFANIVINNKSYCYGSNIGVWRFNGGIITLSLPIPANNETYTVYWKSVWQTLDHFVEVEERINGISITKTGYMEKYFYANGESEYLQYIRISAENTNTEKTFIGWYKMQVYDENASELQYEKLFQTSETEYVCMMPEETVNYFTRWGQYKIVIMANEDEIIQYQRNVTDFDTINYSATVSFDLNTDYCSNEEEFITDLAVVKLSFKDESYLQSLHRLGYFYSPVDLNVCEGGSCLFLIWKKSTAGEAMTALCLYDKKQTSADLTPVYFYDTSVIADLNDGVPDSTPLYLYYTTDSAYGTPIVQVGVLSDGRNEDFSGRYSVCGGYKNSVWTERYSLTEKGVLYTEDGNEKASLNTYLVYRRYMSALRDTKLSELQDQTVSLTQKITYPTECAINGNAPYDAVFAGWYIDSICMTPYDFSAYVYNDCTLYAKWYNLLDYSAEDDDVILIDGTEKKYQSNNQKAYFVSLFDGQYSILYKQTDNLSTQMTVYDVTDYTRQIFTYAFNGKGTNSISIPVTYGRLYKIVLQSKDKVTGAVSLSIVGSVMEDGGSFYPYLSDTDPFRASLITDSAETFTGWYILKNGNYILYSQYTTKPVDDTLASTDEEYEEYTVYEKDILIPVEDVESDIYIQPKKEEYHLTLYNTVAKTVGTVSASENISVGSVVTIRATAVNLNYSFQGWYLYNPKTGENIEMPSSTIDSVTYSYSGSEYKFIMTANDRIILAKWKSSYTKYTISYYMTTVDGNYPINNEQNVDYFYYNKDDSSTHSDIILYNPTRTKVTNGVTGYYIFNGWTVEKDGETVFIDSITPAEASQYADRNNIIKLTPVWGDVMCKIVVQTDEDGISYIELGHYPQTLVVQSDDEYANINPNKNNDGYNYSLDGTKKYIRYTVGNAILYFRFDPIRWNILQDKNGSYLLQTDKVLFPYYYNLTTDEQNNIYPNDWENCDLRYYLNNIFLSPSSVYFSEFEYNLLKKSVVRLQNGMSSGHPDFTDTYSYPWLVQNSTEDIFYLFSYKETTDTHLGFSSQTGEKDALRVARPTDYAYYLGAMTRCSDLQKYILGKTGIEVSYCDCNIFGTLKEGSSITTDGTTEMENDTIQAFDGVSDAFGNFIDNVSLTNAINIASEENAYLKTYLQKVSDLFNNSQSAYSMGLNFTASKGAFIGINTGKAIVFDSLGYSYSDLLNLCVTLLGYEDTSLFIKNAKTLVSMYNSYAKKDTARANRFYYDGSILTQNGTFVMPLAFANNMTDTVLGLIFTDTNGNMYMWINDVTSAMTAIGKNKTQINKTPTITLQGLCVLFAEHKNVAYWLRSPSNNSVTVLIVDEEGRIVSEKSVSYSYYGVRLAVQLAKIDIK